jgi:hypothetical protein
MRLRRCLNHSLDYSNSLEIVDYQRSVSNSVSTVCNAIKEMSKSLETIQTVYNSRLSAQRFQQCQTTTGAYELGTGSTK